MSRTLRLLEDRLRSADLALSSVRAAEEREWSALTGAQRAGPLPPAYVAACDRTRTAEQYRDHALAVLQLAYSVRSETLEEVRLDILFGLESVRLQSGNDVTQVSHDDHSG